jgi:ATP/maltotriose-dependent transcriptional regulator MalT/DNA-binding SARP family transcriptional activator
LPSSSNESGKDHLFQTKLLPPRPGPLLLERPRLIERLVANLSHPVTLVTANAGSGKTTLVADFVNKLAERFVWYQLDQTDADPALFLKYITNGIRRINPGFGQATLAYLQQEAAKVSKQPEYAVDVLISEILEDIEHQLILVLDDYHHLGVDTPVHAAVDRMFAHLPELLHTIIISRDVPPLQLARMRSQGALVIVDRGDLLFTDEETQALFREVFDLEMRPDQSDDYLDRTQGWITALQLVRHMAQRQIPAQLQGMTANAPTISDLTEVLDRSEHDIFDYFAEVVFTGESDDVRRLLLRLSLIPQAGFQACRRLYPETDCAAILPALVRRNVFITVAGDGEEYRLHPLFQSFLRRRLRAELSRVEVAAEHTRIAEYFLEYGNLEHATRHLLASHEHERTAVVIAEKGQEWIGSATLVSSVDALPPHVLERFPRALTFRAEVERLRCEYDIAQPLLQRAAQLMRNQNDPEGEAEALHSLAAIAYQRGKNAEAVEYLDRATELAGERSLMRAKCGNTRGLCFFALGQWAEAEAEFHAALQLAEEEQNKDCIRVIVHNLALPPMIRGDFATALGWWRRLLCHYHHYPPSPQEAVAHLNAARCSFFLSDLEDCEQHLEQAIERCRLFNLIELSREVLEAFGNVYRKRGAQARAADYFVRAARLYQESRVDHIRYALLDGQAPFKLELLPPEVREQLAGRAAARVSTGGSPEQAIVIDALADLTIKILGPVEILRDPMKPFAVDAWTTKRTRDILCFIASRPHRRASKEEIFETFWTEEDPEIIIRNFHPTVSQIRKALNSNQPLKQSFLLYRDGDYLLNSEFIYEIDLENFDRLVSEGETALRAGQVDRGISCFENAIRLYRGEFMQGCKDAWVAEQRSYYREQYLRLLETIVVAAQKGNEWPRSLHFAQRILRDDPFREEIHCRVMRAHAELGNRAAVKEQYKILRDLLRNGLGLEPSAGTTKVYRQLLA